MADDASTPGWDAINAALSPLYPGQEPAHFGTILGFRIGGQDPLDGISAYRAGDGSAERPLHWHFVTYGMSELYEKESQNPEWSGWGFEFTFRVARDASEQQPPMWALNFLQNLARYVYGTGNVFAPGHHMDLNGPIALDQETDIRAVLFAEDPQLPQIDTPHGKLAFVQVVGVTLDELSAARAWDTHGFLGVLAKRNPLLVTDLSRTSVLRDPPVAAEVARRTAEEGSSTEMFFVPYLQWSQEGQAFEVTCGASAVAEMKMLLAGRLPHGRGFVMQGSNAVVAFLPGEQVSFEKVDEDNGLRVSLPPATARAISVDLPVKQGVYTVAPGLRLRVVPSPIKDHEGKIVRVIGE